LIYALKAPVDFCEAALLLPHPLGTFDTVGEAHAMRFCKAPAATDAKVPKNEFFKTGYKREQI